VDSYYNYRVELETIDGRTFLVDVIPYGDHLAIQLYNKENSDEPTYLGEYGDDWKLKMVERTYDITKYELTFTNNRPMQICLIGSVIAEKLQPDIERYVFNEEQLKKARELG
jgi:hypothetical protein